MKAALAAALVNFVWEGAAIGALAWLGFSLARTPRIRYLVGVAALALMAIAPVATAAYFARAAEVHGPRSSVQGPLPFQVLGSASGSADLGRGTVDGREPWTLDRGRWTFPGIPLDQRFIPLWLAAWLVGVAALSLRLALGFAGARRLTSRVTAVGADVQAIASRLINALDIRARVRVVESMLVKVPAVVGAFKPVVLLPAAAMSGLSMEQVEALLAHELAHVRRHDYLVNLLQSAVETLLFYHPAVWLVSRRVRQERELCCDDLALAVCSDRVAYASALADLESLRATPSPALAANGGSLLSRVRRILRPDEVSSLSGRSRGIAGTAILASIVLFAGGQAARARALPAGWEIVSPDNTGGLRSPNVPQIPGPVVGVPSGVPGGVAGGVVGGVQGGVKGPVATDEASVKSGIVGGVPSGVDGGVQGGVSAAELPNEVAPEPPQSAGSAISVGHLVRLEVTVGVIRQMEFNRDYTVQPDGTIKGGYGGAVNGGGLPAGRLQESAAAWLAGKGILPGAKVVASVEGRSSSDSVWVLGEVKSPGAYPWRAGFTVEQMLALAGGPTTRASVGRTHLLATDAPIKLTDVVLAGSTIEVPMMQNASVTVQGAIRNPGIIPLREDRMSVSDAISGAGGFQTSAGSRIWVRRNGASDITLSKADVLQGRSASLKLLDGDTVTVEVAPHVYVTGYVKNSASEFNWEPGLTLAKALAMAGGVSPEGAATRIAIARKDPKTGKFADIKLDKDPMATPIQPDDVIRVPKKRL